MSGADLSIREMTASDIPTLLEIERESFPVPWTAGMFMIQLGLSDESENLVIQSGGRVIGYISSWYGFEEVHILSIAIAPGERGGDGAEMLLGEALERAREAGNLRAVLEVRVSNHSAIKLYESVGYRQVGMMPGYYRDGEDAIIMSLAMGDGHSSGPDRRGSTT